ncbi:hypothetical protein [Belnapia moabensis]|uniref:hypothetical protein n=1 Tax=Belnapia moabensis TaxID=365533 RepID=UPI0005BB8552|nr:hypothetical protein [Belnapia moabensis]
MSSLLPVQFQTNPCGVAKLPEPLYAAFKRSFPVGIDARELAELLEFAAIGASALGWPDAMKHYDAQQLELLRQLSAVQQHDISGNA